MDKIDLSVIIPNRNSPYLTKTMKDILAKAETNIEIIVNIDENWPKEIVNDPKVHYIHPPTPRGMRYGINKGVQLSRGQYIMKCDDHVMFGKGFDRILIENHQKDWVQIPRRYALNVEDWEIEEKRVEVTRQGLINAISNTIGVKPSTKSVLSIGWYPHFWSAIYKELGL